MDDQSRVKRVLGHALPEHYPAPDAQQDLARARDALQARSRRRFRTGLGAVALTMIAGAGVAGVVERAQPGDQPPTVTAGSIELLATTFHAKPYSFDLTPKGWSVQARTPYFVTIVPDDGSASTDPDVFVGKLVISLDHNPLGGRLVSGSGRQVWITGDSEYTTLSMRTEAGEPAGVVRIQYPDDTGWDRAAMVRFLLSVHVGAGARASLG